MGREACSTLPCRSPTRSMVMEFDTVPTADGKLVASPLVFQVDPSAMLEDFAALRSAKRHRQPGSYHDGEWRGISLRSAGGRGSATPSLPGLRRFRDTPLLSSAPYIAEILERIPAPKLTVRLLFLPPGSVIREHLDDFLGFWHGVLRLHIPVMTNPSVKISISGKIHHWDVGSLWYGNFCLPHSVSNQGTSQRVHLVIDTLITERLLALFPPDEISELDPAQITLAPDEITGQSADLKRFERVFAIPAVLVEKFTPKLQHRLNPGGRDWIVGRTACVASRLILFCSSTPIFELDPIDKTLLKIRNWSAGFTLLVPERSADAGSATLSLRLPAPYLPAGNLLRTHTIDLPLLV